MTAGRRSGLLTAFSALILVAAAGCAEITPEGPAAPAPPPPPPPPAVRPPAPQGVTITTPFKAEDFAWSVRPGTARIQGLTARGASCAGNAVALTPATAYSSERMRALYGSTEYSVLPIEAVRAKTIVNDNPAMRGYVRATRCDATGAFVFEKLPAGPYFIIAEVNETAGQRVIMRKVTAVAGRTLQAPLNGPAPPLPPVPRKKTP